MELKYIKRIVLFLLIVLSMYVFFLIMPFLKRIIKFLLKVILPFIISFVLAFILQPLVAIIQKRLKKRWLSVLIVMIILLSLIIFLVKTTLPYSIKEITNLVNNFPTILEKFEDLVNDFAEKFSFLPIDYRPTFNNINIFLSEYVIKISSLPQLILNKFIDYVSVIVVIPMILIYLLLDYEKIFANFRKRLIEKDNIKLKNYLGELNKKMASYFRGSFLVIIILTIVCSLAFSFIRLEYPLFFGFIIAITNVIPYVGPYLGGIFPVVFAFLTSSNKAFMTLLIIVFVQLVESNFLTPYIQSKQTDNHPLLVILFLMLFGKLFGIIGMLIAVPILTILKTTYKYYPIKKTLLKQTDIKI